MTALLIALPCLALSALLVWLLDKWLGGGPVKFHDLTRPPDYLCQIERQPNNELAIGRWRDKYDRLPLEAQLGEAE